MAKNTPETVPESAPEEEQEAPKPQRLQRGELQSFVLMSLGKNRRRGLTSRALGGRVEKIGSSDASAKDCLHRLAKKGSVTCVKGRWYLTDAVPVALRKKGVRKKVTKKAARKTKRLPAGKVITTPLAMISCGWPPEMSPSSDMVREAEEDLGMARALSQMNALPEKRRERIAYLSCMVDLIAAQ